MVFLSEQPLIPKALELKFYLNRFTESDFVRKDLFYQGFADFVLDSINISSFER